MEKPKNSPYFHVYQSALRPDDSLAILSALREQFKGQAIAFFRTSKAEASGLAGNTGGDFSPTLSIIGVQPLQIIQSKNGVTTLKKRATEGSAQSSVATLSANPFVALETQLKSLETVAVPGLPNFQGGFLGYISYDAVRFLEKSLNQNLKPNSNDAFDAELILFQIYFLFDHERNQVSILSALEFEWEQLEAAVQKAVQAAAQKAKQKATQETTQKTQNESNQAQAELSPHSLTSLLGKQNYMSGVRSLKEHILDGDIFQAVLSERFSTPFEGDSLNLFKILSELSPAPYQFYLSIDGRDYLGASPEMLLKCESGVLETHPIAGTRPRGKTAAAEQALETELLADVKEKAEHLMLVDLSRNDIGRVAQAGSVSVDSFMKVKKFGGVMHLVSTVTGKKRLELSSIQAFASCFPAGTLSGAPKVRAMQLLEALEPEPRGFYGGAFMAASLTGDLDSCISIRSISLQNKIATIQVGAGIVADSVPENEYDEVLHKSKLTRLALAIARDA